MGKKGTCYVDSFQRLRCFPDVVRYLKPNKNFSKEVSEAWGARRAVKRYFPVLERPMEFSIVEIGAGHCMFSLIAAFSLPVREVVAVDKRPIPIDTLREVRRFRYVQLDASDHAAMEDVFRSVVGIPIVVAIHPCKRLAQHVVEFYRKWARGLVMIPCCSGPIDKREIPQVLRLGAYFEWSFFLWRRVAEVSTTQDLYRDENILSDKNLVIIGSKDAD